MRLLKFSLFAFLVVMNTSYCQIQHGGEDYEIYSQVFERLRSKTNDTLVVEVGSNPSELMLQDLKWSKSLTTKELKKVELQLKEDFVQDDDLQSLIENISKTSPKCNENGSYTKRYYSKPFYISKSRAIVFLSFATKNKKYQGGKAIGTSLVEIYENNGKEWSFSEQISLSTF